MPQSVVGPNGLPAYGSWQGGFQRIDLVERLATGLRRIAQEKRWLYLLVVKPPVVLGLCVLRTGYAAKAFAFVSDVGNPRLLSDVSRTAPPFRGAVGDGPFENHSFRSGGLSIHFEGSKGMGARDASTMRVSIAHRSMTGTFELDTGTLDGGAPPPLSAVANLGEGRVTVTEKGALLTVRSSGPFRAGDRTINLDGALAAYDYSQGLLPRRTKWRWAMGIGTRGGRPCAVNLTEGFVGEAECALFGDGRVVPLREPRIGSKNVTDTHEAWRIRGADVDLSCTFAGVHRERENFGVVRSAFLQGSATFEGEVRVPGESGGPEPAFHALGVVEDQDVTW